MNQIAYGPHWRTVLQSDRRIVRVFYDEILSDFLSFVYPKSAAASSNETNGGRNPRAGSRGPRAERLISANHEKILTEMYRKAQYFSAPGIEALVVDFAPSSAITPLPRGPQVRASYLLASEEHSRLHNIAGESAEQILILLKRISELEAGQLNTLPLTPGRRHEQFDPFEGAAANATYLFASREPEYGQERYEYRGLAREVLYEWPDGFAITVAGHGSIMVVTYNGHPLDNLMLAISWHHDRYREMVPEITRLYKRGTFISTPFMSGIAIDFTDTYVQPDDPERYESKRFRGAYVSKNPRARHLYATHASSLSELVRKMADFRW